MDEANICSYLGNIEQLAGIREVYDCTAGMRLIEVWNSRLHFKILADRGFDIGPLSMDGKNRVFLSKGGLAHRAESDILGGLFFTCGPDNVGPAEASLPMHGSFRTTRASHISTQAQWEDGKYCLTISGELRHACLFGGNIVLHRTIRTDYGSATISVTDTIRNDGFMPYPLMLLYHINAGYPMLDENAKVSLPACKTYLREGLKPAVDSEWNSMPIPGVNQPERVYYHEGIRGRAQIQILNTATHCGMTISYHADQLPILTQWISSMAGDYALGLEPGNCHVEGLSGEKARGTLNVLQPGECKHVELQFSFF